MTTPNGSRDGGTDATTQRDDRYAVVDVTLTPEQAKYTAQVLFAFVTGEVETRTEIESRDDLADVEAQIGKYRSLLEQLSYGETAGEVRFTTQRGELEDIALRLIDVAKRDQVEDAVKEAREKLAGVEILDRLEATP